MHNHRYTPLPHHLLPVRGHLGHILLRLPDNDRPLPKLRRQVVVVDAEAAEKQLVFVLCERPLQRRLCLCGREASLLPERPKARVVLVVDVCVCLQSRPLLPFGADVVQHVVQLPRVITTCSQGGGQAGGAVDAD